MVRLNRSGSNWGIVCGVFLALILPVLASAQVRPNPGVYPPTQQGGNGRNGRGRCLQQAGLSQGTMQQVRSLHQQARSQIEALCSNTSLTQQQRQQQIREINQRTRQQAEALISPAQRERLQACQGGGGIGHGGFGGGHGGGGGHSPCGSLPGQHFDSEEGGIGELGGEPIGR